MEIKEKKEISPNDRWAVDEFNGMPYRPLGDSGPVSYTHLTLPTMQ